MPDRWQRDEIELGMVVSRHDVESGDPLLYKVIGIVDSPTVVIVPLYERDGTEQEHYVISSPLFAEFRQVKTAPEPGPFTFDYGDRP